MLAAAKRRKRRQFQEARKWVELITRFEQLDPTTPQQVAFLTFMDKNLYKIALNYVKELEDV